MSWGSASIPLQVRLMIGHSPPISLSHRLVAAGCGDAGEALAIDV